MWRTLIKPRLARLFAPIRAAGLPILMHSDGHIEPILPDLVEIGLNMYNPVQPEVTDFCLAAPRPLATGLPIMVAFRRRPCCPLAPLTMCAPPWQGAAEALRLTTPAC